MHREFATTRELDLAAVNIELARKADKLRMPRSIRSNPIDLLHRGEVTVFDRGGILYVLPLVSGGMPQGSNLPARHTQNIQRQYYVDATLGNDATTEVNARDNSANPWLTIQHAVDAMSWPGTGDIAINVRNGTYQAADGTPATVLVALGAAGPSASRFLIIRPDGAATPLVKFAGGVTGTQRGGFKFTDGFCILEGFEVTSPGKVGAANCGGNAVWLPLSSSGSEIYRCHFHDLDLTDGATTRVQGMQSENSISWQMWYTRIHNTGDAAGHQSNQEHGLYMQEEGWVIGCSIYNIRNGYGLQAFPGPWTNMRIISSTVALGPLSGIRGPMVYDPRNGSGSGVLVLRNSIFYQAPAGIFVIHGANAAPAAGTHTIDHCISRKGSGNGPVEFTADFTITNHETTEATAVGFVDAANGDYHLTSSSIARGYTDTTWSPASDIDSTVRIGGSEDAGAYQYVTPAATTYVRAGVRSF